MIIMSAKVSKTKLIGIGLLLVLVIVLLSVLLKNAAAPSGAPTVVSAEENIRTNADRVAFLRAFGWEVSKEPLHTQDVRIPTDPSEVFSRYNQLQLSQGYDLSAYAGKSVKRYVYEVLNYPESDAQFFATLLIYQNTVIGGDICSAEKGGIMQGFEMPS